jgi:hypothetical protein
VTDVTIRIYRRQADGTLEDGQEDYDLSSFGGFLPAVGDLIVKPGVPVGLDRHDPQNREIWTVVGRVFNPRDLEDYVALIVDERPPHESEFSVVAG